RALARLITGYPTHGFVIDKREAAMLFLRVRGPTQEEMALAASVFNLIYEGLVVDNDSKDGDAVVRFVSDEPVDKNKQQEIPGTVHSGGATSDAAGDGSVPALGSGTADC